MSSAALLTILGMALVTYATRVLGFVLLKNRHLGARATAVMQAAPGCVLASVIAPHFASPYPHELMALFITLVAAWRLPMLAVVVVGMTSLAALRHLFNG